MSDLCAAPIGELATFVNGAAFKPDDWGNEGQRIIRIQNLTDPVKPFNRSRRELPPALQVKPGDILVSWSASLGVFEWQGPDIGLLNQHIFRVLPDERRVEKRYLRHGLELALQEMSRHLHGATMKHVNRGEFLSTKIYVPPLPEQRRIAAILDQADALRAKRRRALAQLDALTQSIFTEMFGDPRTILAKWPTRRLGEFLEFLTSGSRGWASHYAESGDLFLRIQNVRHDQLLLDDIAYVSAPDTAEAKRTRVKPGDVLMSITADLGRTAVVPEDIGTAYINQHLSILRTKELVPRYLSAYLASPMGQRQVSGRNRHAVKAGLNFDDIRALLVPAPPAPLQCSFDSEVDAVERLKSLHGASLEKLDALFAALQHRAFRGEL
ncbi:MAG: restriction endonuclease subunit S [Chloroflexi bacterium]|nr:restriction endonuclease subunit S [Chloroflexota bacterium]